MGRLATSLAQLQQDLAASSTRPVDTAQAAAVINEVRRHTLAALGEPGSQAAGSNADLASGISEEHVDRWLTAQGLQPADVDAMKHAAFVSGLANPFGGDLSNALSYVVAPLAGALSGSPYAALGVGVAAAALAPFANALFQSGVVTGCDIYRERNGPTVVLNKADVNDNLSLQQAADQVLARTEAFADACRAFEAARGGPQASNRQALAALADKVLTTSQAMCDAQRQALMTQGSHARQQVGNAEQVLPRTLRPLGAGLPGFGTSSADAGGRVARYGSVASAGLQTGAAVVLAFAHHFAAGRDERNKQLYNNKLNLLYADVFTDAGKAKVANGETLTGDDIDPAKLRKLVTSPAQAFVARVSDAIKARKQEVDGNIQAQLTPLFVDLELGLSQPPASASSESSESMQKLEALRAESAALQRDLAQLKAGDLDALADDSAARQLISQGLQSFRSPVLGAALKKKYSTEGEFSSQAIQRLGQAFHLGIFGSAAASTAGRVASAVVGGASHAPTAQLAGVTAASGLMAYVGASNQYVAISEKNHRRADPKKVSALQQFWNGATALPRETSGQRASTAAIDKANASIRAATAILADARIALDQLPDPTDAGSHRSDAV